MTDKISDAMGILRFCNKHKISAYKLRTDYMKIKNYKDKIDELNREQHESYKYRKFIEIIKEMDINDVRIFRRRLIDSDARQKNLKKEGTEMQKKALCLLEKGAMQEELCQELFGSTEYKKNQQLKEVLKTLMKSGIFIYSMGRGNERRFQLKPFSIMRTPYVPPVPKIEIKKCEDYDKLALLFNLIQNKRAERQVLIDRFGEKELDRLIGILFEKGLAGVKNISGTPIYHSRSSKHEFDARFLTKVITGLPKKCVAEKILDYIANHPDCTRKDLAIHIYGTAGEGSTSKEQMYVGTRISQSLRGTIRIEKISKKAHYYLNGEFINEYNKKNKPIKRGSNVRNYMFKMQEK